MHRLLADPWVAEQIDAAIAPYRKVWPPEAVEAFREEMAATLAMHPVASRLLREAWPTDIQDGSGEVNVAGKVPAEAQEREPSAAARPGRGTGTR